MLRPSDLFFSAAAPLRDLRGRAAAQKKRELAALFSVSPATLSRRLHSIGIVCHRRVDRGERKNGMTEEKLNAVFAIQYSSRKQTQGPIMPAAVAIEIAEKNGKIEAGSLSASTYNGWLRAKGISRAELDTPEPHVALISAGPNHVHQADWSLAINWKIKNNQAVYDELVYKNKLPAAGEPRLWRLIVTDHCSGAFFVWYVASAGENVTNLIDGLWRAWTEKSVAGQSVRNVYPFRGVPAILMLDRGPGAKSAVLENFLARLDVKLNICVGSRSKGQVESAHWMWEQRFESRFRLDPVVNIDRLNDEAVGYAAHICEKDIHTRTRNTRTRHWLQHINRNIESQLRVPNCTFADAKSIAVSPQKDCRVDGSGIIRYNGQRYRVPKELRYEKWVSVAHSPFEFPNVYVQTKGQSTGRFLCQPVVFNVDGFPVDGVRIGEEYRAQQQGSRAKAISAAEQDLRDMGVKVGDPKYIRRNASGEPERFETRGYHLAEVNEVFAARPAEEALPIITEQTIYTRIQAREIVSDALGRPLSKAEAAHVNSLFGDAVTDREIDNAIEAIELGISAPVIAIASA